MRNRREDIQEELTEDAPLLHSNESGDRKSLFRRFFDPKSSSCQYFVFFLTCGLAFGDLFCLDTAAALQNQIISDIGINVSEFSLLYACYYWPNTILCFLCGFLVDRYLGIRFGAIVFAVSLVLGQLVFASGAFLNSFSIMILGRIIFSFGGEALLIVQCAYVVIWFKGKEINMLFGLQLSIYRLGSAASFWTMVTVYDWFKTSFSGHIQLGAALTVASFSCVISLLCALFLAYFDARAEKILLYRRESNERIDPVKISETREFGRSFWIITVLCGTFYTVSSFISIGSMFFQRKYGLCQNEANLVDGLVSTVSIFLLPLFGFIIDHTNHNIWWIGVSIFVTLTSQVMLAFTFLPQIFVMVVMGIGYSIFACALWPMVAFIVPKRNLGTAFGVMQSVLNFSTGTSVILAGYIADYRGFFYVQLFFLFWIIVSTVTLIILIIDDHKNSGFLNISAIERNTLKIDSIETFSFTGESDSDSERQPLFS